MMEMLRFSSNLQLRMILQFCSHNQRTLGYDSDNKPGILTMII